MDSIRKWNWARSIFWYAALALVGVVIGLTVNADSYLERYYDVFWYMIVEFVVTVGALFFTWLWWHLATSESTRVQGPRMWISEHGALSPLISSLPVWLIALFGHFISFTWLTLGSNNYPIYPIFILPLLYMALTYALPPMEIRATILPFGGKWVQLVARGIICVALIGGMIGLWINAFV